jgi:hypothetical protein
MGMRIGPAAVNSAMQRPGTTGRAASDPSGGAARPEELNPFSRADRVEVARAGFGEGTMSPSGAALQTLGTNLRTARRIVRTAQEIREEARARRAEQERKETKAERQPIPSARENNTREIAAYRAEPPQAENEPREAVTYRPTPAPQAARFTQSDQQAARRVVDIAGRGPVRGEIPAAMEGSPRIDVRA